MTNALLGNVRPLERSDVHTVDAEADVIVVGFGAAGTCAAFEATAAGASVLICERAGGPGGAAAQAGGIIYLGGGTATQIAAGFTDTPEAMEAYLLAACGPAPDRAKISAYVADSVAHHDWLVARGVEFEPVLDETVQMEPTGTEGLVWSGGENAWPFVATIPAAPRGHLAKTPRATGWLLMEKLTGAALEAGVDVAYDTRIDRLVVDGGRAVGVTGVRFGEPYVALARKGVVLTAGGFVQNDEMLAQYAPGVLKASWKVGTDGDDGRGIAMAMALGAATKSMHAGECAFPVMPPKQLTAGILVNCQGQRFINEDTYNGRIGQAALFDQDAHVYLIVDEETYAPTWLGLEASWVCESVEELEKEIGLPEGSLVATVAHYNRHAERGEDPVFHKNEKWVRPLTGPIGAFDLSPKNIPYAAFTLGGLSTTVDGEVLHLDGSTIPGLYAAGRTTSGVCSFGYASGLSIGDSTYFGRRAGTAVAKA